MIAPFNDPSLNHGRLSQMVVLNPVRADRLSGMDQVKPLSSVAPSLKTALAHVMGIEASRKGLLASLSPKPSPWLLEVTVGAGLPRQSQSSLLEFRLREARRKASLQGLQPVLWSRPTCLADGVAAGDPSRGGSIPCSSSGRRLQVKEAGMNDVISGRGGRSNHHPGNKRYRQVVSDVKASYRNIGSKSAKTDLSKAIVDHVIKYGGRFLKMDKTSGNYCVLSPAEARKKTSQALREAKDVKWTS